MTKALILRSLLSVCAALCGCVTQSVPNHGGGKRFAYEQVIIANAIDTAIDGLDLQAVPVDKPIDLYIIAMGEEGSGAEVSGEGLSNFGPLVLLGPFGFFFGAVASALKSSVVVAPSVSSRGARDIQYLRGKVIQAVAVQGIPIARGKISDPSERGGALYVLVSELGTAKEGRSFVIYNETKLSARVAMEAFFVPENSVAGAALEYLPLGEGACTTEYKTAYLFGGIPIQDPTITTNPGPIPARILVSSKR